MQRTVKAVRGVAIVQCEPVGSVGVGARFKLEEAGVEIGSFTLLPTAAGWMSVTDQDSSDLTLTISYATSFAAQVSRGEIRLD